jgi:hypothetical protein
MAELDCFPNVLVTLMPHLDDKGRATLRLVNKQVRDVINVQA